jgi:Spy/CpxP family protein refolding chaperone
MRKTLIATLLIAGVAALVAAQGPPPPGPGGPGGPGGPAMGPPPEAVIKAALALSDVQMQSLQGLLQTRQQAVAQLQPQIADAELALAEAIHATTPDPATIGQLTLQLEALRAQIRAADTTVADGFLALLNDEQKARLDQIHATEGALRAAAALHQIGL